MTLGPIIAAAISSAILAPLPQTATQPTIPSSLAFKQPTLLSAEVMATGISWVDRQNAELLDLPSNWDGYGAEKIDPARLSALATILARTLPKETIQGSIVPGADGSLQVEWHLHDGSFGLVLGDPGDLIAWYRPTNFDVEIERSGMEAMNLIQALALRSVD